ncbi:urease accessory protein UreE [Ramlibacter tataouinensis]|uniref:Urease accessory protein UreE n=1 Tax=Ramlibacter tataouinensis TaxID=94132 RepID=A0A127JZV7_9BURK|nr:urease accessory protein UreE [Ramlibacter tataouinensis]
MIRKVLGNASQPTWKDRLDAAHVDVLHLDQWQAQKTRFRHTTEGGLDLAISLERNVHLRDGDVLTWDDAARRATVVRVDLQDVMVIRLDALFGRSPEDIARTCVELGHALGNQHWPAVVKGTAVYVPLTVNQAVMNSVMKTHAFHEITYEFAPGAAIIPYLSPRESRQVFGGADAVPHSHHHGLEHSHDHGEAIEHDHDHPHHDHPRH